MKKAREWGKDEDKNVMRPDELSQISKRQNSQMGVLQSSCNNEEQADERKGERVRNNVKREGGEP